MAWFNCTTSQTFFTFSVRFHNTTLLPEKRPFFVVEGNNYRVIFQDEFMDAWISDALVLDSNENEASSGYQLQFKVQDQFGNNVDTVLLSRNNPDLGSMGYEIINQNLKVVRSQPFIFRGAAETFNCELFINHLPVGKYWLSMVVPSTQNLTIPFTV